MIQLPKRTSLVQETVATLKQWIATGLLKDMLPGEMDLKNRLGVGRDTLRLALKELTEEAWLEKPGQGRNRRIRMRKVSKWRGHAANRLPVTCLSPYAHQTDQTHMEMEVTQKRLAEQGRDLQFLSPEIYHLKDPDHQLENLVRTHPSAGWVLYASSAPVQRWFARRGLPAIVHGWAYPDVNLCYVTKNWEPAGFHAGLQFLRHGHRTIGLFEYRVRGVGAMLIEQGLRRALARAGNGADLLLFKDDRTPESIARAYAEAFNLKRRPTAMVLTSSNHLLTSLSWLVSRGIGVPREVSLTVLPYEPWYADLHPALSCYKPKTGVFAHGMAERVLELVKYGRVIHKPLAVPVEYVPGATIGPAPRA